VVRFPFSGRYAGPTQHTGPGRAPLAALLAAYGQHTLHRVLLVAFGIKATMTHDETGQRVAELNGDPMARIAFLLTDSLHHQAVLASTAPDAGHIHGMRSFLVLSATESARPPSPPPTADCACSPRSPPPPSARPSAPGRRPRPPGPKPGGHPGRLRRPAAVQIEALRSRTDRGIGTFTDCRRRAVMQPPR
jgi:hypothetical protein